MRASKENAEEALQTAKRVANGQTISATRAMNLVQFLEAAKKKLPYEAAYSRDNERGRKKAASRK